LRHDRWRNIAERLLSKLVDKILSEPLSQIEVGCEGHRGDQVEAIESLPTLVDPLKNHTNGCEIFVAHFDY